MTVVDVGLLHPRAHRGLGQIEITRDARRRVPRLADQLDNLSLELLGERPTTAGLLRPIVSIMMDILSGVTPLIVDVRQTGSGPQYASAGQCSAVAKAVTLHVLWVRPASSPLTRPRPRTFGPRATEGQRRAGRAVGTCGTEADVAGVACPRREFSGLFPNTTLSW